MKLDHSDKEPATIRNELTTNRMVCENNPLPIWSNRDESKVGETPVLIEEPHLPQKRSIGEQHNEPTL
jgi:hypothetical protein